MTVYTVHLQGHDGSGIVDFYLADQGYNTSPTDTPPNQHFRPTLQTPATFEQSLDVGGVSQIGFGEIVIVNADGRYDNWLGISFDGRPCIVKVLDDPASPYGAAPIAIMGVVEDVDIRDAYKTIRIRLYDQLLDLDQPLLANRYGGTTLSTGPTADGDESLAGAIIKRCYGECPNIELDLANPSDLIYQASDGPVASIIANDGGIPLTFSANYATLAALQAASLAAASYATALSTASGAYVRLGSLPLLFGTFDVVAGATVADRSTGAIAKQILTDSGYGAMLDAASFTALHAAAPGVTGLRIADETTAKAALQTILKSVTGWCLPNAVGLYRVGRIAAPEPTPVAEFAEWQLRGEVQSIDPQDGMQGIPVWRVVARYRYLGRAHTAVELKTAISDERRNYLLGPNVYREVAVEDATVKDQYKRAGEMIIETRFINAADALAEATNILGLRKVKRRRWQFSVEEVYGRSVELVSTIQLSMSRFMPDGQNFIVLRRLKEYVANRMTFDVWG